MRAPAATATFTYGGPAPATSDQAGAMAGTVASMDAFKSAPSAGAGMGAANGGVVTGALLTGSSISSFSPSEIGAADPSAFDVPACVTTTTGKITFSGCRVTVNSTSGTSTTTGWATVSGSITAGADGSSIDWDLAYQVSLAMSGSNASAAPHAAVMAVTSTTMHLSADLHSSGHVVVTATTAVGTMNQEVGLTASLNGQTVSAGVDESLAFDLTHSAACGTGVTGGTLEAKRIWTSRPSGATAADLPDEALKIAWTGCGAATVQVGTR